MGTLPALISVTERPRVHLPPCQAASLYRVVPEFARGVSLDPAITTSLAIICDRRIVSA